jgi:Delta7-sterol 5-desaturase
MSLHDVICRSTQAAWRGCMAQALLYMVCAGLGWFIFPMLLSRRWPQRRISPTFPTWRQVHWEIIYSVRTTAVFGAVAGVMVLAALTGWTRAYWRVEDYGWAWFACSIAIAIFVHDAYFYWTHRLMHHRRLYRILHRIHHLSISPTPWTTYSFSIGEACLQAAFGPLLVLALPMHPAAFLVFVVWQIVNNVLGHCGYEIWPSWFLGSWIGKFLNNPTHHALHHEDFRSNYGLYFNIWDRWMGTNHRYYVERFRQATADRPGSVVHPELGSEVRPLKIVIELGGEHPVVEPIAGHRHGDAHGQACTAAELEDRAWRDVEHVD